MTGTENSAQATAAVNESSTSRGMFWATLILLGVAFLLNDHSYSVSQQDAFTGTADEMQEQAGGGNLVRRLTFPALGLFGLACLLLPGRPRLRSFGLLPLLIVALLGWCTLSVAWSSDPSMTARRIVVLLCLASSALGISRCLELVDLLKIFAILSATFLTLGIAAEVSLGTFRPWAGDYRFSGTLHPNSQGMQVTALCLSSFCLFCMQPTRKFRWAFLFVFGFVFLVLTKSRTSTAGMLVALTPLWTLRLPTRFKLGLGFGLPWMAAAVALAVLLSGLNVEDELTELAFMGRQEQSGSLTGRVPIWTTVAPYAAERLFVGHGYDSFWTPEVIEAVSDELHWGIREAHSAYFDTVLAIGVIGLVLLLSIVFVSMTLAASRYLRRGDYACGFYFGLYTFALINALTESGMSMPMFVPYLIACGTFHFAFRQAAVSSAAVAERLQSVVSLPSVSPMQVQPT